MKVMLPPLIVGKDSARVVLYGLVDFLRLGDSAAALAKELPCHVKPEPKRLVDLSKAKDASFYVSVIKQLSH